LRLPGDINALAISPDGSELYTISSQAGSYYQHAAGRLDVIDTDAYAVSDTIAVAADPVTVTVSPDGARLYLTHDDIAGITTIELSTHRAVEVCLDEVPLSVTFSPDSTHAYMPHLSSLTVIDTVTLEKTRISTGELPRGVLFSPDGKRAYITNIGDHAVTVVDTVTGSVATTLAVGGNPEAMAASPDDERLYVGDYWSGTIAVIARPSVQDEPEPSTDQA
jgi:YVTN family beta-propeller protein